MHTVTRARTVTVTRACTFTDSDQGTHTVARARTVTYSKATHTVTHSGQGTHTDVQSSQGTYIIKDSGQGMQQF